METAELLRKLRALTSQSKTAPDGWYTTEQWAAKWGVADRSARRYLKKGFESGLMEMEMFRQENARQVVQHFRAVEPDGTAVATGCAKTSGR